jgi:hypothetical protein
MPEAASTAIIIAGGCARRTSSQRRCPAWPCRCGISSWMRSRWPSIPKGAPRAGPVFFWGALIRSTDVRTREPWRFRAAHRLGMGRLSGSRKLSSALYPWLASSLLSFSNAVRPRGGRMPGQWVDVGARRLIDGTALDPRSPTRRPVCKCSIRSAGRFGLRRGRRRNDGRLPSAQRCKPYGPLYWQ